ncbi:uncharacterized protein ATNIH1004_002315 [Aspergillus tanneri]|uniref:Uncharacterized protein n=1 Tax=Aspergillus tanneri TaxID=1220188 RepID=A0A5M9MW99_9EURO|nr:uncharacterized protein ATNIH1004_002315 [Aspergillus tanneri]KAA8649644.1 hypothetical protein ATNIH1004_002315 [Aspergillus tanneri]
MEKVDDGLIIDDPYPGLDLETCKDRLEQAEEDLQQCQNPPPGDQNTTPSCGGTHRQRSRDWKVFCDHATQGSGTQPIGEYTTSTLAECIDLCARMQSEDCKIAVKMPYPSNNCKLSKGPLTGTYQSQGAQFAVMQ